MAFLAPRLKKGYHHICEANLQPKNAQRWPQVFLALTPSVKRASLFVFSIPDAAKVASIPRRIQTHFARLATLFQRILKTASH